MAILDVTLDNYVNEGRVIWNNNDSELDTRLLSAQTQLDSLSVTYTAHNHNDLYYTKSEIDEDFSSVSGSYDQSYYVYNIYASGVLYTDIIDSSSDLVTFNSLADFTEGLSTTAIYFSETPGIIYDYTDTARISLTGSTVYLTGSANYVTPLHTSAIYDIAGNLHLSLDEGITANQDLTLGTNIIKESDGTISLNISGHIVESLDPLKFETVVGGEADRTYLTLISGASLSDDRFYMNAAARLYQPIVYDRYNEPIVSLSTGSTSFYTNFLYLVSEDDTDATLQFSVNDTNKLTLKYEYDEDENELYFEDTLNMSFGVSGVTSFSNCSATTILDSEGASIERGVLVADGNGTFLTEDLKEHPEYLPDVWVPIGIVGQSAATWSEGSDPDEWLDWSGKSTSYPPAMSPISFLYAGWYIKKVVYKYGDLGYPTDIPMMDRYDEAEAHQISFKNKLFLITNSSAEPSLTETAIEDSETDYIYRFGLLAGGTYGSTWYTHQVQNVTLNTPYLIPGNTYAPCLKTKYAGIFRRRAAGGIIYTNGQVVNNLETWVLLSPTNT